jgi:hypothetical protein
MNPGIWTADYPPVEQLRELIEIAKRLDPVVTY